MGDETEVRKLPVWRTVKAAYLVLLHNPRLAIKLAAIPLALAILPLLIQSYLWSGMTLEEVTKSLEEGGGISILVWILPIIGFLSMIPMITAWHRLVLLGHDHPEARIRYTIGGTEWSYFLRMLLFFLLCFLFMIPAIIIPTILGAAFATAATGVHIAIIIGTVLIIVPIYAFILRACLVFPAAAIGESLGFIESWLITRGNSWRILFAFILAALPTSIIMMIVAVIFDGMFVFDSSEDAFPDFNDQLIVSLIHVPVWIIGTCASISVWSWCYRFIVQGEPITLPGE